MFPAFLYQLVHCRNLFSLHFLHSPTSLLMLSRLCLCCLLRLSRDRSVAKFPLLAFSVLTPLYTTLSPSTLFCVHYMLVRAMHVLTLPLSARSIHIIAFLAHYTRFLFFMLYIIFSPLFPAYYLTGAE